MGDGCSLSGGRGRVVGSWLRFFFAFIRKCCRGLLNIYNIMLEKTVS